LPIWVDGTDGTSIVWQGTYASHPASPSNGWAYYNSTDGKSYVYQSGTWYQMTVDGVDGANGADGEDGLSIVWHGDATSPDPSWEVVNHCYRDTDNGYAYIYNGSAWELMVRDGSDGTDGADGTDGLSLFVTYHDNAADNPPSTPTGDGTSGGWHTNVTSSVVWISQKIAASASEGTWGTPIRISGTAIWSEVINDGGKPEDGATVGATWGQDIAGQPFDMQNLVKKPTFEDGSAGTWVGNTITLSDVTGQVWTKALASSSRHVIEYSPYTTAMPTCVPGEKFYLEADVNTEASPHKFILYARFVTAAMGSAKWVAADELAAGQGWTRLKGVVTAPANCMYVMVDLFTDAFSGFGTVLVTNIHLSRYNPDADVTAEHQGDINIDNIQDGSSYKKLSAANLTALQSAINMDTPQPRSGWEGAFTNDSPSAGYVAWTAFVVRYQGTDYTVSASNSNNKYLYWNAGATKTQLYGTDTIGDAVGVGKFAVGYNDGGTFYPSQFFKFMHGALIQAHTIMAEQYAELRQTMPWTAEASCDASHPFTMDFKLPSELTTVISAKLSFKLRPFRAHSTGAASGGGSSPTSGNTDVGTKVSSESADWPYNAATGNVDGSLPNTASGKESVRSNKYTDYANGTGTYTDYADGTGSHRHPTLSNSHRHLLTQGTDYFEGHTHQMGQHQHALGENGGEHTHDVVVGSHNHTVTISPHTHGIAYGIYEESNSPTVHYHVDNGAGFGGASSDYTEDQVDLDISGSVSGAGWKSVRFDVTARCRITAILEVKVDITA
ncbi:MAG: hypothetical protein PHG80_12550, partial [Methanoregulaceae archaeon]|nr:hypothetical protein [Methanoregulaceae archaeon]